MEHQSEKKQGSEIFNTNESSKVIKKLKKKEKKNYKDLKDLLDNIKEEEEEKEKKKSHLKKKNIKKDNIIKKQITENENEININKETEKEIEDLSNNNNNCNIQSDNSKRNSTTNSSSISQEEIINDIHDIGNKTEFKKINNDSPKYKRLNYILKQREIINGIDKDTILNNEFNNSKNISPICKYHEGSEKTLQKMNDIIIDINNSINFIKKNSLSSNFNFNNDRFIKKNNLKLKDNNKEKYINLINYHNNLIFNNSINLNHINYNYNNNNKNYNNGFFNNLNINLFYNNSYMNKEIGNNLFEEKEKCIFDNKKINNNEKYEGNIEPNKNYNLFFNINNYILQNVLPPEKNISNIMDSQKEYISPLINNYNLNQNNLNNLYSLILNNTNNSNIFNNDIKNFNNNINNNSDNNNINNNNINNNIDNNIINNNSNNINTEYYENKKYYIKMTRNKKNIFSRRPNDWICSKCYNLNFGFRVFCNRCSAPKGQSNSNNIINL